MKMHQSDTWKFVHTLILVNMNPDKSGDLTYLMPTQSFIEICWNNSPVLYNC